MKPWMYCKSEMQCKYFLRLEKQPIMSPRTLTTGMLCTRNPTTENEIHNHFLLDFGVSFCPSKNLLFPEKTVLQAQLVLPA